MQQWVIALGGTGSRLLEGLVYAAMAGVLTDGTGHQLHSLHLVTMDTDRTCGDTARAEEACRDYEHVRTMLEAADEPTPGWFTALDWSRWPVEVVPQAPQGRDRMLSRTLLGNSSADILLSLAAEEHGEQLRQLTERLKAALAKDGGVRVLLCASSFGVTGQAMLSMLARMLRERFADTPGFTLGAVVLLPYIDHPEKNSAYALRTRAMLTALSAEDMLREENSGVLDTLWLLGMPAGFRGRWAAVCGGGAEQRNQTQPIEWLALRCAADFLAGGQKGCLTVRLADARLDWSAFGSDAAAWRRAWGGLMKASVLYTASMREAVRGRLVSGGLESMLGWQAAFLKGLHRRGPEERARLTADLDAIERCLLGAARYLREAEENIPEAMRASGWLHDAQERTISNYRKLLDASGRLFLMEDEIIRSGMEEEQIVRRSGTETDADRLIRAADEQLKTVNGIVQVQNGLDANAGGWVKLDILRRMRRGIDYAMAEENSRAEALRTSLAAEEKSSSQDKDLLYRLETHLRILAAQRERVDADMADAVRTGLRLRAPAPEGPGRNGFFSAEVLTLLRGMESADKKELRRLTKELESCWPALVLPEPENRGTREVLTAMAQGVRPGGDTHPFAVLLGRLLTVTG